MSKICYICGKKTHAGRNIKRRGLAKSKGGVGKKITGITRRVFKPNLLKIRINTPQGKKRVLVCTKCLKKSKVEKAL